MKRLQDVLYRTKQKGFTIVELLIVIVIIGILAAIVIVAYNGITNQANDTAVQNDLASAAKAFELYRVDTGSYPDSLSDLNSMQPKYPIKASKQAYVEGAAYNFAYCWVGGSSYALAARSKSGQAYYVASDSGGVKEFSGWAPARADLCDNAGHGGDGGNWGYRGDTQTWQSWAAS